MFLTYWKGENVITLLQISSDDLSYPSLPMLLESTGETFPAWNSIMKTKIGMEKIP